VRTYGILDLGLAALYAWLGFAAVPSRSPTFRVTLIVLVTLLAASGISLLFRARWSRHLGIAASALTLVVAALTILGLVASAAYLRGIYGPLGKGMAIVSLAAAALVVELFALVPLFQLRFHLRR
jgi:hypothetical protein